MGLNGGFIYHLVVRFSARAVARRSVSIYKARIRHTELGIYTYRENVKSDWTWMGFVVSTKCRTLAPSLFAYFRKCLRRHFYDYEMDLEFSPLLIYSICWMHEKPHWLDRCYGAGIHWQPTNDDPNTMSHRLIKCTYCSACEKKTFGIFFRLALISRHTHTTNISSFHFCWPRDMESTTAVTANFDCTNWTLLDMNGGSWTTNTAASQKQANQFDEKQTKSNNKIDSGFLRTAHKRYSQIYNVKRLYSGPLKTKSIRFAFVTIGTELSVETKTRCLTVAAINDLRDTKRENSLVCVALVAIYASDYRAWQTPTDEHRFADGAR